MLFSSALLLGSWAAAQADPFQRAAPVQSVPTLRGGSGATSAAAGAGAARGAGTAPAPLNLTGVQNAVFGTPRSSNDGNTTRVVFDLPAGVKYTLAPTFGGLRLDVAGARVVPAVTARLGPSVTEYRAGGGQVTLVTPFPLSLTDGWRASEATIAGGTRVLILEFGATLSGGAASTVKGAVLSSPPATSAAAQAALNTPLARAQAAANATRSNDANDAPTTAGTASGLPPGDSVVGTPALPPAPALPGADADKPSALSGQVPGTLQPGLSLGAPRVGKNPGLTRMVLDLPPGSSYRIVPGGVGLRVEISGAGAGTVAQTAQNVSPEVRSWRYEPSAAGLNVIFVTGTPTTARSGWRAQLLSPNSGDRSRLAIDFSPALADLTPLNPREKLLAAVPPMSVSRGTAILALSASYARPRVIIDPGHGGVDPGAVGSVVEKQVTLDVGLRVRELLRAAGVEAVMTRDSDRELSRDKNTDLNMRAAMGTPGTQMYVSIHVNAMPAASVLRGYGVETWWNANHPLSAALAQTLQQEVVAQTGAFNQGLRNNRSLAVLRNSRVPAALIEIGYTSHPVDGLNLRDDNYLDRVALGIAAGIRAALMTGVSASGIPLGGGVGGAGK
ncbi:N-acetylmuramoyl-L-alanine amidase family protein [Deinococcus petrolearius]|uniref:N-acetylmuramoyl-L-alanine amidase n=1 Tax=Deinococcus petrolearius TaxID=1751295 RepID=A0ABW1DF41_9DEIO